MVSQRVNMVSQGGSARFFLGASKHGLAGRQCPGLDLLGRQCPELFGRQCPELLCLNIWDRAAVP